MRGAIDSFVLPTPSTFLARFAVAMSRNRIPSNRRFGTGLAIVAASLMAGCATVGPDYVAPEAAPSEAPLLDPLPAPAFDGVSTVMSDGAVIDWWRWFGSPELDRLVQAGFANSPTLDAAQARLTQAAYLLRAERGLLLPEISANGTIIRQRSGSRGSGGFGAGSGQEQGSGQGSSQTPDGGTDGGLSGATGGSGGEFTIYTAQIAVDYNLDPFGREIRLIQSAQARLAAARAEVQAAYLALAGNIVSSALEAAAIRQRQIVTRELIEGQRNRLELTRIRVEEGYSARADLVAAEAEIRALEAQLPGLRRDLTLAEARLATLTGRVPAQADLPELTLASLTMPRTVPITIPSTLVRERPDIRAAEARLAAASAEIGVATASLYPDLTLSGSAGLNGIDGPGFGPTLDFVYSAGIGLLAPLFQGGRLRAQRDVQIAAYQEALALFQETVLSAFEDVAGGISALDADGEALMRRIQALEAAQESLDLTVFRYREGAASLFDVLQAERTYQEARLSVVEASALRFQDTAALLAAVAGGPLDDAFLAAQTGSEAIAATRAALDSGRPPALLPAREIERTIHGRN